VGFLSGNDHYSLLPIKIKLNFAKTAYIWQDNQQCFAQHPLAETLLDWLDRLNLWLFTHNSPLNEHYGYDTLKSSPCITVEERLLYACRLGTFFVKAKDKR